MLGHAMIGPRRKLKMFHFAPHLKVNVATIDGYLLLSVRVQGRYDKRAYGVCGEFGEIDECHLHDRIVGFGAFVRPILVTL